VETAEGEAARAEGRRVAGRVVREEEAEVRAGEAAAAEVIRGSARVAKGKRCIYRGRFVVAGAYRRVRHASACALMRGSADLAHVADDFSYRTI
jgi:hypothetical protein